MRRISNAETQPAVWLPTVRTYSGTDIFTERLAYGLNQRGIKAEITWLPHRAEYAPWTVSKPVPPAWANIAHINTWLHRRYLPSHIPLIATTHHCVHGDELARFKTPAQAMYHRLWILHRERSALKRAHIVTAVSDYTASRTKAIFGVPDIVTIHSGIDLKGPFQLSARTAPHKIFRLLYVGNWSVRKGVDLLAQIMNVLGPGFELLYTAPPIPNAPENMHSAGNPKTTNELASLYQEADALLFPSRLEGFGLVALEAQACGLPVIATRGSALPEVIEDGVTGLLCAQDDARAFAYAARKLTENPTLWQQMRRDARRRVESRFSLDTMIDRYFELYRAVLSGTGAP